MNNDRKKLMEIIDAAISYYESEVVKMTDQELWDHCFADNDIVEDDFCTQVLKERFLGKSRADQFREGLDVVVSEWDVDYNIFPTKPTGMAIDDARKELIDEIMTLYNEVHK